MLNIGSLIEPLVIRLLLITLFFRIPSIII